MRLENYYNADLQGVNVKNKLKITIDLISFKKEYGKNKTETILNIGELLWKLPILICFYTTVCTMTTEVLTNYISNIWVSLVGLISNIGLLVGMAILVRGYIKCYSKKESKLKIEQIMAIIDMTLLIHATYFLVAGILKDSSISFGMALTNITLYIGFAVSLEDLLDIKSLKDFLCCFYKPFSNIKLSKKWWLTISIFFILIVLFLILCLYKFTLIIVCVLLIVLLLSSIVLSTVRKNRLKKFADYLAAIFPENNVLILQIGADYVVIKSLIKIWVQQYLVDDVYDPHIEKYDMIVILNSLSNKSDYICYFEQIKDKVKRDAIIIDPFLNKRGKKKKIAAYLGIPVSTNSKYSTEEYFEILQIQTKNND